MEATFVIVGGGIAGVTCAETLALLQPDESILLLSESSLIKTATNIRAVTKTLLQFDVEEKSFDAVSDTHKNIKIVHDSLVGLDDVKRTVVTSGNIEIKYKYLCLCMGAKPKLISQAKDNPYVLGIRDTDSVETLVSKLSKSKRIIVVGNGGIATELIYKVRNVEVVWVIKDKHITATFVDPGAAEFFQPSISSASSNVDHATVKRMRFNEDNSSKSGAALGPDWYNKVDICGSLQSVLPKTVSIMYEMEVRDLHIEENTEYPLEVTLTNGSKIKCDFIVSATGVQPRSNINTKNCFALSEDGGIQVDDQMRTSLPNIYAAGDLCNANWNLAKHWFQMKLWTQAHQMGAYAAKCMSGALNKEEVLQDFCFEIFAHSTKLFGYKVILLGLYNGQKLGNDYEILLRMTKGVEYIKFVLQDNKLQGALLIGDTDLEEMCENLILNQLDLSPYGDDILNPNIDIEDYFD